MGGLKFLTQEQKESYKENGFIKLSGVFTEKEMKEISDVYNELFERKYQESRQGIEAAWTGDAMKKISENVDYSVKSIHNLQMHNGIFTKTLTNSKLLDALEDIMDTENILLHHTKAHIKPPENGAPYLMHQDYHYFPFKKHTMLAVFLHLDDTNPENGGLAIYPGSHKLGPLEDFGGKETNEAFHWVDPKRYPLSEAMPVTAKKGEIVMFSYLTLHGSYLNKSTRTRRMFLIQVRDVDDEPCQEDVHKSPCQGLVLRGKNVKRDATMANRFVH